MDRLRKLLTPRESYQPISGIESDAVEGQSQLHENRPVSRFSRVEYGIFFLLGVSMLWAWYVTLCFANDSTF